MQLPRGIYGDSDVKLCQGRIKAAARALPSQGVCGSDCAAALPTISIGLKTNRSGLFEDIGSKIRHFSRCQDLGNREAWKNRKMG